MNPSSSHVAAIELSGSPESSPLTAAPGGDDLMALAQSIGGPLCDEPNRMSKEEERVCAALCLAALRRNDEARVAELLAEFGGDLPIPGESDSLLRSSARAPQAPAYEILSLAAWRRWRKKQEGAAKEPALFRLSEPQWLGLFLRSGLVNQVTDRIRMNRSALWGAAKGLPRLAHEELLAPVKAAFSADNPLALAKAMMAPGWREALLREEPAGRSDLGALSQEEQAKMAHEGRFAERCLLSQTVSLSAPRCALLLLGLPEFSQPLLRDELPSLDDGSLEKEMQTAKMWVNLQSAFPTKVAAFSPENEFEGVWRSYSFFDRLLQQRNVEWKKEGSLWHRVIEAAIDAADQTNLRPQQGTGRGWAEMIAMRSLDDETSLRFTRRWLERLRDKGACVDWERASLNLKGKRSEAAQALGEWAALEAQSVEIKGSVKPKRL